MTSEGKEKRASKMSQNDKAQLEDRDVPLSTESGKEVTKRTENPGQTKEPELDPEKV